MEPLKIILPFNCDCLHETFVPGKNMNLPADRSGLWLLIQEQALLVVENGAAAEWQLPRGGLPDGLEDRVEDVVYLGTYRDVPCWAASIASGGELPAGLRLESLLPARTRLTEDVLSLGGLALQAVHWQVISRFCPRCGERTAAMPGELGKRCPGCAYEHYPHLHPAIIVLVRDGDQLLLTRKSFWPANRYGLVAGFVDAGESLEGAVQREVQEEVGVRIRDLRYITSQYWPFPSQLMVGFTAAYAGGDLRVNTEELEDARWFSVRALPDLPPRLSIARFLLDVYGRPRDP